MFIFFFPFMLCTITSIFAVTAAHCIYIIQSPSHKSNNKNRAKKKAPFAISPANGTLFSLLFTPLSYRSIAVLRLRTASANHPAADHKNLPPPHDTARQWRARYR